MRETKAAKAARIKGALDAVKRSHPDAAPQLIFSSPFELLIATMLSAQCTDKQVNKTTAALFPLYNTPQAFAALGEDELCALIKSCGLYKTKAKNIIATSRILEAQFGGEVPKDRDVLMTLPGVGRKTANVVVSNAFGVPAIAVDTHVFRVANRIGLADASNVLDTEKQLMENIPREDWSIAHHWLIFHGRQVCAARNPKCAECAVREYCLFDKGKK
mgnify:CR=1 FL=1